MVTGINCLHVATPQRLPRVQKPRSSPYRCKWIKGINGSFSSINLNFRGLLLDGKIFRSILVSLMRSSVDTSSKRGMEKAEETAGVTEHIIPSHGMCYGHPES